MAFTGIDYHYLMCGYTRLFRAILGRYAVLYTTFYGLRRRGGCERMREGKQQRPPKRPLGLESGSSRCDIGSQRLKHRLRWYLFERIPQTLFILPYLLHPFFAYHSTAQNLFRQ